MLYSIQKINFLDLDIVKKGPDPLTIRFEAGNMRGTLSNYCTMVPQFPTAAAI